MGSLEKEIPFQAGSLLNFGACSPPSPVGNEKRPVNVHPLRLRAMVSCLMYLKPMLPQVALVGEIHPVKDMAAGGMSSD